MRTSVAFGIATRTGLQIESMWADTTANCEAKPLGSRVHEVEVEPSSARAGCARSGRPMATLRDE